MNLCLTIAKRRSREGIPRVGLPIARRCVVGVRQFDGHHFFLPLIFLPVARIDSL